MAAGRRVAACADEPLDTDAIAGAACRALVEGSERARLAWQLEVDFARFERRLKDWGFAD